MTPAVSTDQPPDACLGWVVGYHQPMNAVPKGRVPNHKKPVKSRVQKPPKTLKNTVK
jgi:hypothetical protein